MTRLWDQFSLNEALGINLQTKISITGICINSLELRKGDLFIALQGGQKDAHIFIKEALNAGAACVLADNYTFLKDNNLLNHEKIIVVENCVQALQKMAHFARRHFKGRVIAVTGSVGKTTTKDMLYKALSPYGETVVSKKSLNNHLGVPLSLISLPHDAKFAVLEVGMNHPGEIQPLAEMIQPHIALITAINKAHAGNMGGEIGIAKEKACLLQTLPKNGIALYPELPLEIKEIVKQYLPLGVKNIVVGKNLENNLVLKKQHLTSNGSHALLTFQKEDFPLHLSAPGTHLLEDAAMAMGVIFALGLEPFKALKALQEFKPGSGRGEKHPLQNNLTLIDETHNASPASVRAMLEILSLQKSKRKIAVLGDMLELGEFSQKEHLSLVPLLIQENIIFFGCGKAMKAVFEKLPPPLQGGYAKNSEALIAPLQSFLKKDDYLIIKGSHSLQMNKIVRALKSQFSLNISQEKEKANAL